MINSELKPWEISKTQTIWTSDKMNQRIRATYFISIGWYFEYEELNEFGEWRDKSLNDEEKANIIIDIFNLPKIVLNEKEAKNERPCNLPIL